jgi:hypothetical protein
MIIYDLEFFNSCDQECEKSEVAIRGGTSSSSASDSFTIDGKTFSLTSIEGEGDDVYSVSMVGDKVIKKHGKGSIKYGLGSDSSGSYELTKETLLGYL